MKARTVIENDSRARYETVPAQEIEDLFSEPVFGTKLRNEDTVLANWKKFMSRNTLTETQYKNIVADYNNMNRGLRQSKSSFQMHEPQPIDEPPLDQRRQQYSTKVHLSVIYK